MKTPENYKKLCDYSNEELYEFIKRNESEDVGVLACICSEILKRILDKDLKIKEIDEK